MDREQPNVCEEKHLQIASFDAVAQRRQQAFGPHQCFRPGPCGVRGVWPVFSCSQHLRSSSLHRSRLHASTFLPPVPRHGFAIRTCGPHCGRGTMKALTPAPVHRRGRSPRLPRRTVLPFRLQPRRAPRYRFVHHARLPDLSPGFALNEQARRYTPPNRVRHPADRQFTSGCSPPRLATTQLPSVTELWQTPTRTCTVLIQRPHRRTRSRVGGNPVAYSEVAGSPPTRERRCPDFQHLHDRRVHFPTGW